MGDNILISQPGPGCGTDEIDEEGEWIPEAEDFYEALDLVERSYVVISAMLSKAQIGSKERQTLKALATDLSEYLSEFDVPMWRG